MIWYMAGLLLILHAYFWGWGLTLCILPGRWRRFWPAFCGPVGLGVQSAVVWAGTHTALAGTDRYARASLVLPAGLMLAVIAARGPRGAWKLFAELRRWWAVGVVMAVSLTLQTYPFTRPPRVLTSIAMTSCDAADYAAGARVFKEFAHGDRTGFLGAAEPVAQLGVDNFFDFWLRINHFSPSALIALDASMFRWQPHELTTLMGVVLLTIQLPGVFWLARSAFGFGAVGSLAVAMIYGVSPSILYAVYQVALGQLMAASAVTMLTWAGLQAHRGPGAARRYAGYSGLMLAGNWLLLGSYNFFLPFAYVPLVACVGLKTLIWGRRLRAARWAGFVAANFIVCCLLVPERVVTMARRFFLFDKTPFGWPIPGFYPSGWYGGFVDIYLHPGSAWWLSALAGACLAALAAAIIWQGRSGTRANLLAASCALPIFFGYWLLLREDARLHDNASYDAYKLFTVFYPGILAALCLWIRAAGRAGVAAKGGATLLWVILLTVNVEGVWRFNTYIRQRAFRITSPVSALSGLEARSDLSSVNVRLPDDWDRLWANYFLLRKPQYFTMPTYEGRPLTPLLGRWDLEERPRLATAHFAGEADPLRANARFTARDRQAPRFLDVRLDTGWHQMETLGDQYWCWSAGPGQFVVMNPHQGNVDCLITFSMRGLRERSLRLCAGPRCWWEGNIGTQIGTVRNVPFTAPPGTTTLRFESREPADHAPGDTRPLAFSLSDLEIEVPDAP